MSNRVPKKPLLRPLERRKASSKPNGLSTISRFFGGSVKAPTREIVDKPLPGSFPWSYHQAHAYLFFILFFLVYKSGSPRLARVSGVLLCLFSGLMCLFSGYCAFFPVIVPKKTAAQFIIVPIISLAQ